MDQIQSVKLENQILNKLKQKILEWDARENPLAPLDDNQLDALEKLNQILSENEKIPDIEKISECSSPDENIQPLSELNDPNLCIESTQEFLSWYNNIDDKIIEQFDSVYLEYYDQLKNKTKECDDLLEEIDTSLGALSKLTEDYNFVSNKTSALHRASENLIQEQNQLIEISDDIKNRLKYFTQVEYILQRLQNPTFTPSSDQFADILNTIDNSMEYLNRNPNFKETATYNMKYKQCLLKAVQMIKFYVTQILAVATEHVLSPKNTQNPPSSRDLPKIGEKSSEAAFALYYGKFQASSLKIKKVTALVEERYEKSPEYENLLSELHQFYLSQRALIMSSGVENAIKDLCNKHRGDHCALVRAACTFLVHICQDEHRLFYQFFAIQSSQLTSYMEGICTILYDTLRPFIIHIIHLETLAEICSILRVEMIEEHVQNNQEALEAFGRIANQMLQDAQERLVFRTHLYLQSDIQQYHPSPGDLAYPEKLEMMESIALSLQENQQIKRADSRSSLLSLASTEVEQNFKSRTGNSPADLHGMWYPTVRRTLVCLSRLYRCIDRTIFQGLSQEALSYCIQSVSSAAHSISSNKTSIDGELFEIKHLLILREQIAPFRVDFTVKETSLDFSKVKTAAFELLHKRKQLFALGSNNAILEFLLDGTPLVKEHLLDSRKDVDRQLKSICEVFIKDVTKQLVGPILGFLDQTQNLLKQSNSQTQTGALLLRQQPWAAPQQISSLIQESQRNVKNKLAGVQRSMQLYLANKDTEFILFRPIRNNIIGAFMKLENTLTTNGYTSDDLIIVSCPTSDQVAVLISSASLVVDSHRSLSTQASVEKKISISKEIPVVHEEAPAEEVSAADLSNSNNASTEEKSPEIVTVAEKENSVSIQVQEASQVDEVK